jgi:hypothetical protein
MNKILAVFSELAPIPGAANTTAALGHWSRGRVKKRAMYFFCLFMA